jgi:DNA-binding NarL/FixJ family response regulator
MSREPVELPSCTVLYAHSLLSRPHGMPAGNPASHNQYGKHGLMTHTATGHRMRLAVPIADAEPIPKVRTVLICDAQELSRVGLRTMIDDESDLRVEGEVESSRQIGPVARRIRPDVIVVELDKHLRDTLDVLRSIAEIAPVVVLSPAWNNRCALYALRAGVHGLVGKTDRKQVLMEAVRTAARGEMFLTPPLTAQLVERMLRRTPVDGSMYDSLAMLTERERGVLRLLAIGKSTDEMAADMYISSTTVKSHISHMLSKLGLRDRVQAVVLAHRMELVED